MPTKPEDLYPLFSDEKLNELSGQLDAFVLSVWEDISSVQPDRAVHDAETLNAYYEKLTTKYQEHVTNNLLNSVLNLKPILMRTLEMISEHAGEVIRYGYEQLPIEYKEAIVLHLFGNKEVTHSSFFDDINNLKHFLLRAMIRLNTLNVYMSNDTRDRNLGEFHSSLMEGVNIFMVGEPSTPIVIENERTYIKMTTPSIYLQEYSQFKVNKEIGAKYGDSPRLLEALQSQIQHKNSNIVFINLFLKSVAQTFAHEMVHGLRVCKVPYEMIDEITNRPENFHHHAANYRREIEHCGVFKLTLLALCRYESSPIYIRPDLFDELLSRIQKHASTEFYIYDDKIQSIFLARRSHGRERLSREEYESQSYTFEPKMKRAILATTRNDKLDFTFASEVDKTTEVFADHSQKSGGIRKNYAKTPSISVDRKEKYKAEGFVGFPVLSFNGETNLLKIGSTLDPFERLLHIFIQSRYEDAAALSTKPGEAGLYMYINGEDVEFLFVSKRGKTTEMSLSEVWWLLSM